MAEPSAREKDQGKAPAKADAPEDPRYPVEYLVSHSQALLGTSRAAVVAGALSGHGRKTFSATEASDLLAEYVKPRDYEELHAGGEA